MATITFELRDGDRGDLIQQLKAKLAEEELRLAEEERQQAQALADQQRETFFTFRERQGCDCVEIRNGTFAFANGAWSDGQWTHHEPPSDRWDLLRSRRRYYRTKLGQEETAWDRYKSEVTSQQGMHRMFPQTAAPATRDAPAKLREGAERIAKLRTELEAIDRELDGHPEALAAKAGREQGAERAQEAQTLFDEIQSVNV